MPTSAREATTHLVDLLRREHHALAEFLVALAAFDSEKRWMELGYASLFSFLQRELRLSAGAAQYRKTAAELIQRFPQVEAALRDGHLCLSSVIEVAKVITPENVAGLLPQFVGLSARDAAFLATSIRPVENPPRREFLVTPIRATSKAQAPHLPSPSPVQAEESLQLRTPETAGTERATTVLGIAVSVPTQTRDRPKVTPLDADRARVNMTVSRRVLDKLAAARDALSHSHPGASEETIIEVGLDLIVQRHAKRRGIGAKPRKAARASKARALPVSAGGPDSAPTEPAAPPPPPTARSRHIPAAVWRAVWERDHGCCAWPLDGGGVCGSTLRVQLDHIDGFALGAGTTIDECRLLCALHQDVSARQLYGDDLMNRYTAPKGGRCSEPVALYAASTPVVWNAGSPPLVEEVELVEELELLEELELAEHLGVGIVARRRRPRGLARGGRRGLRLEVDPRGRGEDGEGGEQGGDHGVRRSTATTVLYTVSRPA